MKTWNSDFSHEAAAFQQEVVVHLQISSVKKTQVLPYVWCLYCSAKDHRSGEIKPESVLIITEGLHDITLQFFCFLLYRIQELCPNHSGNYKPAAAFIRTQCLPETLKCLGFPNQKKQTQHLTKQLHCWIHLCARTKLVLQSCGDQFFSHRAIADSLPPFFNLDFGTYSLPLTIIISTIFKRLGVQINWCIHN